MDVILLYHVSNPKFRESILDNGLLPKMGDSYLAHYENKENMGAVIFLSRENDYDSTWDDDRYLIKLSLEEFEALEFQNDPDVKNGVYTSKPIPSANISLFYMGTGEG